MTCLSCNEIVHTVDGGDFGWVYGHRSVGIGDEGVAAIAGGCPRLKVVNVSYCANITDASLRSLAQGLRDLVQLELRACINVTSVGLCYLAASCKHLRELDVKRCCYVSDPGIHAIAQGCPNLRQVQIHCLLQIHLRSIYLSSLAFTSAILSIFHLEMCHIVRKMITSSLTNVSGHSLCTQFL